jgi:hypothetical protein
MPAFASIDCKQQEAPVRNACVSDAVGLMRGGTIAAGRRIEEKISDGG